MFIFGYQTVKPHSADRVQTKVNLHVRDALRGIRFAVRKSGQFLNEQSHQVFPDQLHNLAHRAARKLDKFSDEMERVTCSLGGPFQKSASPDSTFFSPAGYRPKVPDIESEEASRALYFGLYYAFQNIRGHDVLISEALCLDCILELEEIPEINEPPTLARHLLTSVLNKQVFRSAPSEPLEDEAFHNGVTAASFAVAMWFFLSRDADSVDEQSLLDICCEVTQYSLAEVIALQKHPEDSEALFARLLDIIGETGMTQTEPSGLISTGDTPVNKSARRLRWFMKAFTDQIADVTRRTGVEFAVDNACLRQVFLKWVKRFELQKPHVDPIRQFYITYPAAIMLQELILNKPLRVNSLPPDADLEQPAYFWPEGYAYVLLCMNVRSAIIEELLDVKTDKGARFNNINTWRSFKENVHEDPSTTIGFFQLFVGEEPQWESTNRFDVNNALENAQKLYVNAAKRVENSE